MSLASPPTTSTMLAAVHDRYGGPEVLEVRSLPRPEPAAGRVLVRVRAASVNAYDWHVMRGEPYLVRATDGVRRPKQSVAGVDFAGVVEALGPGVTGFRPGDEVLGEGAGAFAEYVAARDENLVIKPAGVSFEAAAALPMAGATALQAIRDKGGLSVGQRVLVDGAGGGVGTFAVQIACALGGHVTAVTSPSAAGRLTSLGASRVIDRSREDLDAGDRFDLILDISGRRSLTELRRHLTPDGTLVLVGPGPGNWIGPIKRVVAAAVRTRLGGPRLAPFLADYRADDMRTLLDLMEGGRLTPVIDRVYPLRDAADAIRRVESGEAVGKVIITT
jgi:NADPH:quinone reductase-like Zn-dependent oxidoreductase